MVYTLRFFFSSKCSLFHNFNVFGSCIIRILYTKITKKSFRHQKVNPLTPTAPLTSKRCILYIYSTNIGTQYFKHGILSVFFSSKCSLFHNSNLFGSCIIFILCTGCTKIKKIIPAPKG